MAAPDDKAPAPTDKLRDEILDKLRVELAQEGRRIEIGLTEVAAEIVRRETESLRAQVAALDARLARAELPK